jgi:hypothetical protein
MTVLNALPFAAAGQFLRLDADWLGRPAPASAHAGGNA